MTWQGGNGRGTPWHARGLGTSSPYLHGRPIDFGPDRID